MAVFCIKLILFENYLGWLQTKQKKAKCEWKIA